MYASRPSAISPVSTFRTYDVEKRIGNIINYIEEGIANASVKQRLDDLEGKKADLEIALAR